MNRLLLVVVVLGGCASAQQPGFLVQSANVPETRALPPDPSEEPLSSGAPTNQDWVEPLEAGSCLNNTGQPVAGVSRPCPVRSGIVEGETRAMRDGLFRIRYREMRTMYLADRQVWGVQRDLYEGQLHRADQRIQSLQPNWFERNAFPFGVVTGVVAGGLISVGLFEIARVLTH